MTRPEALAEIEVAIRNTARANPALTYDAVVEQVVRTHPAAYATLRRREARNDG